MTTTPFTFPQALAALISLCLLSACNAQENTSQTKGKQTSSQEAPSAAGQNETGKITGRYFLEKELGHPKSELLNLKDNGKITVTGKGVTFDGTYSVEGNRLIIVLKDKEGNSPPFLFKIRKEGFVDRRDALWIREQLTEKLDEKNGFRTLKLGTPVSELDKDKLRKRYRSRNAFHYEWNADKESVGEVKIKEIQVGLNEDIVTQIRVFFESIYGRYNQIDIGAMKQRGLLLREMFIEAYGEPVRSSLENDLLCIWEGTNVMAVLQSRAEGLTLTLTSRSAEEKALQVKTSRDAESLDALKKKAKTAARDL